MYSIKADLLQRLIGNLDRMTPGAGQAQLSQASQAVKSDFKRFLAGQPAQWRDSRGELLPGEKRDRLALVKRYAFAETLGVLSVDDLVESNRDLDRVRFLRLVTNDVTGAYGGEVQP